MPEVWLMPAAHVTANKAGAIHSLTQPTHSFNEQTAIPFITLTALDMSDLVRHMHEQHTRQKSETSPPPSALQSKAAVYRRPCKSALTTPCIFYSLNPNWGPSTGFTRPFPSHIPSSPIHDRGGAGVSPCLKQRHRSPISISKSSRFTR